MSHKARAFSREFKLAAVRRILAGERVRTLADELGVWPKLLYDWRNNHERGGPEALRSPGRPRKARVRAEAPEPAPAPLPGAPERIAALERKVGQQAMKLDFFRRALQPAKASSEP